MKYFMKIALLAMLSTLTLVAQQNTQLSTAIVEQVEKAISTEMARQNVVGMSVAVVTDHQVRWSNGFGFADIENNVPAKATTVYRLASISKSITAVAAMQLVEQGKLNLNAPVQQYVPSFPQKRWPLTSRHLLSHIGGVRHYRGNEIDITRHYATLTEGLEIFKDDTLLSQPGTRYSYTTYGFNLLGVVVEGASGKSFVEYSKESIFKPAGMDRMQEDNLFEIIPNRAQGYWRNDQGELKNSRLANTSYKIPGGGFSSTVEDLGKFAIALQTGKLLKPATMREMFTPQKLSTGKTIQTNTSTPVISYGFGWFVSERNGQQEVYHSGSQQRVNTFLYMLPEKKFAVVLMANTEGTRLADLARTIADIVVQKQ